MKKNLHLAIAIVCMLTLFLSTASCLFAQPLQPQHSACDDCPKHAPISHETPVCCSTSQQPSAATASVEAERPALTSAVVTPLATPSANSIALIATHLYAPPLTPPLIALRI